MTDDEVRRGAGIYSKAVLGFYDALVVKFSNSLVWRCPSPLMLAQYDELMRERHLDVGPGTGWFLAHARLPKSVRITLMDLNRNSLASASNRISDVDHDTLVANVLEPIPASAGQYGSIGINYVLHCVPGSLAESGQALRNLADRLDDEGVLFGSTILGKGVRHNFVGRAFMGLYNRMGIFHNRDDDAAGLEVALRQGFGQVKISVIGAVAMFSASEPLRASS